MAKGHVRKRGDAWAYVLELPRGPDQKRRQKWKSGFKTKREAQAALNKALAEVQDGTYVESTKLTVRELMERWHKSIERTVSPNTHQTYGDMIRCYILPELGEFSLARVKPLHVEELTEKLDARLAPATVRLVRSVLGLAFDRAVRWKLIPSNPEDEAIPYRSPRAAFDADEEDEETVGRALSADELAQILAKAEPWFQVAILIAAGTGMRRGEVLGVRWTDLDLERGILRVRQAVKDLRGGPEIGPPKTKKSRRTVTLPSLVVLALQEHRTSQVRQRMLLGDAYQEHHLVLPQPDGRPRSPAMLTQKWRRLVRSLGINARYQDLRHTQATVLIHAGLTAKVVSERLGHSQVNITLNRYTHVPQAQQDEAAQVIELHLRKVLLASGLLRDPDAAAPDETPEDPPLQDCG